MPQTRRNIFAKPVCKSCFLANCHWHSVTILLPASRQSVATPPQRTTSIACNQFPALRYATGMSHPDHYVLGGTNLQAQHTKRPETKPGSFSMAGDEGFEPPITGPEPVALPLGQSPIYFLNRNGPLPCHDKIFSRFFAAPPQLGSLSFVRASGLAHCHRQCSRLANPQ